MTAVTSLTAILLRAQTVGLMQHVEHHQRPLVADATFIQATRDSGYRNTSAAVAELIDNSLQAGATDIRLFITDNVDVDERHVVIAVLDNGAGMSPEALHSALQFGGTNRFGDRSGFGRFGMGLPNSSVSQTKRVEVTSWQSPSNAMCTYLDVDELASGALAGVPTPSPAHLPPSTYGEIPPHGTLVVWSRCDRLSGRRAATIAKHVQLSIARMFRRALWNGTRIAVNNQPVVAHDPLFSHEHSDTTGAVAYGPPLCYELTIPHSRRTSTVTVQFTELPVEKWHQLSNEEKRRIGIVGGAGASVLRAGREIDYGWHLFGSKRRENYDDWWRCEIAFDPELDELFGVTHSKQGITPTRELRAILGPDLEGIARALNARARAKFDLVRLEKPSRAADTATRRDTLLPPAKRRSGGTQSDRFSYRLRIDSLESAEFFSCSRRGNVIRVTLNRDHVFFDRLYEPSLKDVTGRARYAIETLVLAAARAYVTAEEEGNQQALHDFLLNWSHVLSAFSGL